jgi:hypothetical protein
LRPRRYSRAIIVRFWRALRYFVHRHGLTGEPDLAAHLVGLAQRVVAGDRDGSAVGLEQRGQDPDRGRLTGAVGSEQGDDGALRYREIDLLDRLRLPERLPDPVCVDDHPGCHIRSISSVYLYDRPQRGNVTDGQA